MNGYTQELLLQTESKMVDASALQVGDVVCIEDGRKLLVRSTGFVGSYVAVVFFGLPADDVWYWPKVAWVEIEALTFTEEVQ